MRKLGKRQNNQRRKIKTFVCEICHCITPITCEGGAPNVCCMCVPLDNNEEKQDNFYT